MSLFSCTVNANSYFRRNRTLYCQKSLKVFLNGPGSIPLKEKLLIKKKRHSLVLGAQMMYYIANLSIFPAMTLLSLLA